MLKLKSLTAKLIFMGAIMLVFLTIYITAGLIFTHHISDEGTRINLAGSLRYHSFEMAWLVRRIIETRDTGLRDSAVMELKEKMSQFERIARGIKNGDKELGVKPLKYEKGLVILEKFFNEWDTTFKPMLLEMTESSEEKARILLDKYESRIQGYVSEIDGFVSFLENDYKKSIKDFDKVRFYTVGFFFIITVFIIFYARSSVIKPVHKLRDAAKEIEKGDFDVRVDAKTSDDIGVLGSAFNSMAQNLNQLFNENIQHLQELKRETDLFTQGPVIVFKWINREGWQVEYVSPNITQEFGYQTEDLINGKIPYASIVYQEDLERVAAEVKTYSEAGATHFRQEYRIIDAYGKIRWLDNYTIVVRNINGEITHYDGYVLDITERKRAEEGLSQHSKELLALADASNVIAAAMLSTENIYEGVCDIVVRNFGLRMAWVGTVEEGSYDVKPLAQAGFEDGYLSSIKVSKDSPTGRAIKTLAPQIINDINTDPQFTPWRDEAAKRGYKSMMSLPLISSEGKIIGVLNIYSSESLFFTKERARLFFVFANHAATALENARLIKGLEERVEQRTAELMEVNTELKKLSNAIEQSADSIVITDINGTIQYVNPAFCEITGYRREEAIGNNPRILKSGMNPSELYDNMWKTLLSGRVWGGTLINKKKSGDLYYESATIAPVLNDAGKIINFIAVKKDVTDKVMTEEELKLAKLQAEAANKAKSDFLANMSHELRTPLNAIMGFSEMMTVGMAGALNDKQREFLNDINESGHHLLSLINDILDLSKIEAGKMELELREVSVKEVIKKSLAVFKEKALKHNIKLSADIKEGAGTIIADERKLKQVMFNLLSNAMKFTPDGGSVSVQARKVHGSQLIAHGKTGISSELSAMNYGPDADFIEVSVTDTGIGISQEDQKKLFQPFQQLDTTLTKRYPGTGLGLNLCKKFVELHGGRIWVESEVGKGSKFVFVIPTRR